MMSLAFHSQGSGSCGRMLKRAELTLNQRASGVNSLELCELDTKQDFHLSTNVADADLTVLLVEAFGPQVP